VVAAQAGGNNALFCAERAGRKRWTYQQRSRGCQSWSIVSLICFQSNFLYFVDGALADGGSEASQASRPSLIRFTPLTLTLEISMSGIRVGIRVRPWRRSTDGDIKGGDAVGVIMDGRDGKITAHETVSLHISFFQLPACLLLLAYRATKRRLLATPGQYRTSIYRGTCCHFWCVETMGAAEIWRCQVFGKTQRKRHLRAHDHRSQHLGSFSAVNNDRIGYVIPTNTHERVCFGALCGDVCWDGEWVSGGGQPGWASNGSEPQLSV
jgi:hypothetical protein